MSNFEVQIESVIAAAERLASKGVEISAALNAGYQAIANLGTSRSWIGNQYNNVVNALNSHIDTLNSLIRTSIAEIPDALSTAAQNYAIADGISIRAAAPENVTQIEEVQKPSHRDGEIVCKDGEINDACSNFTNNFQTAASEIASYRSIFHEICNADWVGAAMESYSSAIEGFAISASTASADINNAITSNMREALDILQGAESNTQQVAASQISHN